MPVAIELLRRSIRINEEEYRFHGALAQAQYLAGNREEALNSLDLVDPAPGERWLLSTSAFHMPRTFGAFCRLNWRLQPFPVDYRTPDSGLLYYNFDFASHLGSLNLAVREWTGLLAYRLTGRTSSLLPGPREDCEP